jgi:phage tail sheath protein FI|nr:phage tail protein [Acutalibacter muris]
MPNLGVHVNKKATAVSIPAVADSGIPFFVGTAPVHTAAKPGKSNYPLLCTSWDEAVEKLGFSYDWKKYTLCEAMYSHFQLFGAQPAIFCNVLDPGDADMRKPAQSKAYDVAEHRVTLPLDAIHEGLKVTSGEGESAVELKEDEDYTLFYDEDKGSCIIELLEDSEAYSAASLTVEVAEVDPGAVISADIVMGIGQADACMTAVGVIPDLLLAPGWSHDTVVAAILATKAAGINGLFGAKCLIDADSSEEGVTEYSQLTAYKNKNNFVDVNQIVCWPQVKLGDYQFHLSTQLAGLMASVDTLNGGCPYESPSNKNLKIDGCCLEDGTEVNLTWEQVNLIAGSWGVVTAINFMGMGWTAKGNYTACYPANTDVKDQFIPVSRMFDWVGNTLIRTFWSKLDRPMNRRLIDNILDTGNIWLNGQVAAEHLLGARAEMLESENNLLDLMAGIIHIHIYITPPSPMQECDFTLEYDVNYVQAALG